jgi:predicted transposase/invertase (TIGR01784 family)
MKQDDLLWKGIIEDMPKHCLLFFFQEADKFLDFSKGFEFLDKELEELFPVDNPNHPRFVDKLIKAFTHDGREEWILIHIEVQGYPDDDFGKRMFTYFYRLLDRYNKPVTALAIFTDDNPNYNPKSFVYEFMGTAAGYRYNTYKVIDQDEASLAANPNPFALVVLTVLLAIRNKKSTDETLLSLKTDLFRMLLRRKMEKSTLRALVNFLKMYVHFSKPDSYRIFEKETKLITNDISTMGIEELILQRAEQKGIEKGIEKGIKKGIEKGKAEVVANLIAKLGLSNEQAADVAGVSVAFVKVIREKLV